MWWQVFTLYWVRNTIIIKWDCHSGEVHHKDWTELYFIVSLPSRGPTASHNDEILIFFYFFLKSIYGNGTWKGFLMFPMDYSSCQIVNFMRWQFTWSHKTICIYYQQLLLILPPLQNITNKVPCLALFERVC